MTNTPLFGQDTLDTIKSVLSDVFATFAKETVTLRQPTLGFASGDFGEKSSNLAPPTDTPLNVMYAYTTASDGKYDIVDRSDKGAEEHDGFRLFIWKDYMTSKGVTYIDAEKDRVIFKGKEYIINFAAPSAQFGDLGDLLWEVEVRFRHRG